MNSENTPFIQENSAATTPHEVMGMIIMQKMSPLKAWREHLSLTQEIMAQRMGISQAAYAQLEAKKKWRKSTREKLAKALGLTPDHLE